MKPQPQTLWDNLLKPLFQTFLIDDIALKKIEQEIDWEAGKEKFSRLKSYPEYYQTQNFHGIKGGYLTQTAALTYDPITRHVLPPNETWVRQALGDRIGGEPRRILDLGCGTGTMTLMLKEKFPQAQIVGLDLSPQMLIMADYKAKKANLTVEWCQGLAEKTEFKENSFDLITATLLFHETPPLITRQIMREVFRLLTPNGQFLILDGNQNTLLQTEWLTQVFEEPYIKDFAQGNLETWLKQSQFEAVKSDEYYWIHQITQARKPLAASQTKRVTFESINFSNSIPVT
ncbi:MAG: class I SAM-dependent methyltransferase [Microcystaceae cyanobacterium]